MMGCSYSEMVYRAFYYQPKKRKRVGNILKNIFASGSSFQKPIIKSVGVGLLQEMWTS